MYILQKRSVLHVENRISMPLNEDNRHYREFLLNVADMGIEIVEMSDGTTVPAWVQEKADAWKANNPEGSNI